MPGFGHSGAAFDGFPTFNRSERMCADLRPPPFTLWGPSFTIPSNIDRSFLGSQLLLSASALSSIAHGRGFFPFRQTRAVATRPDASSR
ncbi:hypothetical protein ACRALDRAFT_1059238 [Sodiomyces alcalophilus JCM 7366]|uniref:uncharacterized protein n=1 Tax=Sodiomyces alcalophilus JCM 7366 TaxID=591952 RepID=UPI0039B38FB1